MLVVHRLARVLLKMQALNADPDLFGWRDIDKDFALADDRVFMPRPLRIAWATHSSLMTGSMPGIAASTSDTWLFGGPPNSVEALENNLDLEMTWA
jgi:hypothetical protein